MLSRTYSRRAKYGSQADSEDYVLSSQGAASSLGSQHSNIDSLIGLLSQDFSQESELQVCNKFEVMGGVVRLGEPAIKEPWNSLPTSRSTKTSAQDQEFFSDPQTYTESTGLLEESANFSSQPTSLGPQAKKRKKSRMKAQDFNNQNSEVVEGRRGSNSQALPQSSSRKRGRKKAESCFPGSPTLDPTSNIGTAPNSAPSSLLVSRLPVAPAATFLAAPSVRMSASASLLEAQECGEIMECIDEAAYSLDGLKAKCPLRVQQKSAAKLAMLCASPHHRRVLQANGLLETVVDSVLQLRPLRDPSLSLSAAALCYSLCSDLSSVLEGNRGGRIMAFLLALLQPCKNCRASLAVQGASQTPSIQASAKPTACSLCSMGAQVDECGEEVHPIKSIFCKPDRGLLDAGDGQIGDSDEGISRPDDISPLWVGLKALELAASTELLLGNPDDGKIMVSDRTQRVSLRAHLERLKGASLVAELTSHLLHKCWKLTELPVVSEKDSKLQGKVLRLLLRCFHVLENLTFMSQGNQGLLASCRVHGVQVNVPSASGRSDRDGPPTDSGGPPTDSGDFLPCLLEGLQLLSASGRVRSQLTIAQASVSRPGCMDTDSGGAILRGQSENHCQPSAAPVQPERGDQLEVVSDQSPIISKALKGFGRLLGRSCRKSISEQNLSGQSNPGVSRKSLQDLGSPCNLLGKVSNLVVEGEFLGAMAKPSVCEGQKGALTPSHKGNVGPGLGASGLNALGLCSPHRSKSSQRAGKRKRSLKDLLSSSSTHVPAEQCTSANGLGVADDPRSGVGLHTVQPSAEQPSSMRIDKYEHGIFEANHNGVMENDAVWLGEPIMDHALVSSGSLAVTTQFTSRDKGLVIDVSVGVMEGSKIQLGEVVLDQAEGTQSKLDSSQKRVACRKIVTTDPTHADMRGRKSEEVVLGETVVLLSHALHSHSSRGAALGNEETIKSMATTLKLGDDIVLDGVVASSRMKESTAIEAGSVVCLGSPVRSSLMLIDNIEGNIKTEVLATSLACRMEVDAEAKGSADADVSAGAVCLGESIEVGVFAAGSGLGMSATGEGKMCQRRNNPPCLGESVDLNFVNGEICQARHIHSPSTSLSVRPVETCPRFQQEHNPPDTLQGNCYAPGSSKRWSEVLPAEGNCCKGSDHSKKSLRPEMRGQEEGNCNLRACTRTNRVKDSGAETEGHDRAAIATMPGISQDDVMLAGACAAAAGKVLMNVTNHNKHGCAAVVGVRGMEKLASVLLQCVAPSVYCKVRAFCSSGECHCRRWTKPSVALKDGSDRMDQEPHFSAAGFMQQTGDGALLRPREDDEWQEENPGVSDLLVVILGLLVNIAETSKESRIQLLKCTWASTAQTKQQFSCGNCNKQTRQSQCTKDVDDSCSGKSFVLAVLCGLFLQHQEFRLMEKGMPSQVCSTNERDSVVSKLNFSPEERHIGGSNPAAMELVEPGGALQHTTLPQDELSEDDVPELEMDMEKLASLAEGMIVAAHAAVLLAFLSRQSTCARHQIESLLPTGSLGELAPVLLYFSAFHQGLSALTSESAKNLQELVQWCLHSQ